MAIWGQREDVFTVAQMSEDLDRSTAWVYDRLKRLQAKPTSVRQKPDGKVVRLYDMDVVETLRKDKGVRRYNKKKKKVEKKVEKKVKTQDETLETVARSALKMERRARRIGAIKKILEMLDESDVERRNLRYDIEKLEDDGSEEHDSIIMKYEKRRYD